MALMTMFHAILVPLDGSRLAEQAISAAAGIARRAGAALHFAMVHEPPPARLLTSEPPRVVEELDQEARMWSAEYLETAATAVRTTHGLPVTTACLNGQPATVLAEYIRGRKVDLTVMTTHGTGGLNRWWLGSVADRLLRRTSVPVLLLHPRDLPQPTEFHRILVALDGEIEGPVLEPALALGSLGSGACYLLTRVVAPAAPILSPLAAYPTRHRPDWAKRQEIAARNYLARLSSRLQGGGFVVRTEVVVARAIAEAVLDAARSHAADLIAVGTHGASGAERLILGSVADKVLRTATQPVLVAPAPD